MTMLHLVDVRRRLTGTWLLAMTLAAVAGCDKATAAASDPAEPVTIVYWTRSWWGDPKQFQADHPVSVPQWQRERIAEFERDHPGVRVDLQVDPGGRGDKIRLAFAGGVPPDVFHGNPEQEFVTWAASGFLEPIDPYLTPADKADFFPVSLEAGAYDGRHYAWPFYNHALCMAINRDLFRERGLGDRIPGPQEDWTFEEFAALARQLTFDRDGDGRVDVYGVGLHALDENHVYLTSYLVNFGARVFDQDSRFVLDTDAGRRGIGFLRRLLDEGVATPGVASYKFEDVRSLFLEQRVAMYLTGASIVDWAEDQSRKGTIRRFDWAVVPIPHEPQVAPTTYLAVGAVYVSRQQDPRKRDAAMALARYITSPEVNRAFWERASPRRSTPPPSDPNMAVMMDQVARARNFMLPPVKLPDRLNMNKEMTRLYQDAFAQRAIDSAETILQRASDRINGKLQEGH